MFKIKIVQGYISVQRHKNLISAIFDIYIYIKSVNLCLYKYTFSMYLQAKFKI